MSDLSFRFPRFFVTSPAPCPYLPGRTERKIFAELRGADAVEMNEALSRIGFRRSQSVVYRPSCDGCRACVSVRVLTAEFAPTRSQKRLIRRHADLVVTASEPWTTPEQFRLLQRYLGKRHPKGGMAGMDAFDYADMVEQTPVDTLLYEYREPAAPGRPGALVGAALTDQHSDGLSMIYAFFDATIPHRAGLGTYIILEHIARTAAARLPHVYLGYAIEGCRRMAYKTGFRPFERLTGQGWVRG